MKWLLLVSFVALAYAKHEYYAGWKSYYVGPATSEQLNSLGELTAKYELDFLSHATARREGVVLVQPEHQDGFVKELKTLGVQFRIHADDVKAQLDIDDQLIAAQRLRSLARDGGKQMPYNNYQELDVIYAYMDDVAANYPDVAKVESAGDSFEGRPIKYMKVSTTNFEDTSKPIIFIDGGIHSREWISPPSVTYAIKKLVEDVTEPDLLERFDWILMPVVNPDGYVFSFTQRFWRKTRSTNTHSLSLVCPGVDGNRNYDFYWGTVGTATNPCSDVYAGNGAFSEVETQAVRKLLHQHLARIAMYLTMHSYGSMILYPWGHDGTLSNNALALHTVGIVMANTIHDHALPHFPLYEVGNSLHVIGYGIAGSAEDYAHYIGIPLSFTYELPGLGGGWDGFHLNPRYIEQVCYETWQGIAVGARRAGDLVQ